MRVVPRVERGEFINAGVILSCAAKGHLQAHVELDEARLLALEANGEVLSLDQADIALRRLAAGDVSGSFVLRVD